MKKRLISLVLTLVMVLSLVPATAVTAWAENVATETEVTENNEASPAELPVKEASSTEMPEEKEALIASETTAVSLLGKHIPLYYVSASGDDSNKGSDENPLKTVAKALAESGETEATIVLLSDITENVTVGSMQTITLDLNGFVLKGTGTDSNPASVITNNGTLTVTDSNPSVIHKFATASDAAWTWDDELESNYETVLGGCITGGTGTSVTASTPGISNPGYYGGGICNFATLTVICGNIVGNSTVGNSGARSGSGIMNAGTATVKDGCVICGNIATDFGGGVYNGGTFAADNITISDNTAKSGGGVYNANASNVIFIATDTTISGNMSTLKGSGVYAASPVTAGGNTKITGNVRKPNSVVDNLCIYGNALITIGNSGGSANEMEIGVSLSGARGLRPGPFTTNGTATDVQHFFSDSATYSVKYNAAGYLELVEKGSCVNTRTEKEYKTIGGALAEVNQGDTIKLLKDVTENVTIASDSEITLDLNGHVLATPHGVSPIYNCGNLTIRDSDSSAVHYFNFVKDGAWTLNTTATSGIAVSEITGATEDNTVIKIPGGVITGVGSDIQFAGIYNESGSSLTIEKANIVGNNTQHSAIYNVHADLTIHHARILGNAAYSGAGVKNYNGTATIGTANGSDDDVLIAYNTTTSNGEYGDGGGGIYNILAARDSTLSEDTSTETAATLTIHHATIRNNKSAYKGGGVSNAVDKAGTAAVIMNGGIIRDNASAHNGGGVANYTHTANGQAVFTMPGGTITGNQALTRGYTPSGTSFAASGGNGGGIANNGTLNISGSATAVSGNEAVLGGGIYNAGTLTIANGSVSSNKALTVTAMPFAAYEGLVGGVYNDKGNVVMTGGAIAGNTAANKVGGLLNEGGGFVMTGGSINGNSALSVGGVAQLGTMYLGGSAVIKGNLEGTATPSNLMTAAPVYLGACTVPGFGINVPALASGSDVGITLAANFNAENYSFTTSAGQFTANATATDAQYFSSDSTAYAVAYRNGVLLLRNHEHAWAYTASGATITATCTDIAGACDSTANVSVTISASNVTYDGKGHVATLSNATVGTATDLTIRYTKDGESFTGTPTDVGTYIASVTAGGAKATKTFTISSKSTAGLTVATISDVTYTGTAHTPSVTVKDGTKTLSSVTDYTLSYASNTDAGTAEVTITMKGNYSGIISKTFTIAPKVATVTALPQVVNCGDEDKILTKTIEGVVNGDTLTGITLTRQSGSIPGVYTITVTVDGGKNPNYTVKTVSSTYTINPYVRTMVDCAETATVFVNYGTRATVSAPAKTGYHFAGWYLDTDCTESWNSAENVTVNRVVYAKWVKNVYTLTVNVSDSAVVTLKQGKKVVATATTVGNTCSFADLPADTYTVEAVNGQRGVSTAVQITKDTSVTLTLPAGNATGVVEVKDDTPDTFVSGLDALVNENLPTGTDHVKIVLTVESKQADALKTSETNAIKTLAGDKDVQYLDLSILKTVYDENGVAKDVASITDTGNALQSITFAYPTSGRNIYIYRYHDANQNGIVDDGETIALQKTSGGTPTDGTYSVGDGTVTIYATKFSTYAVAYSNATGNHGGHSGSGAKINSAKTGDMGTALYCGFAIVSLMGSDVVIGTRKRKEF